MKFMLVVTLGLLAAASASDATPIEKVLHIADLPCTRQELQRSELDVIAFEINLKQNYSNLYQSISLVCKCECVLMKTNQY